MARHLDFLTKDVAVNWRHWTASVFVGLAPLVLSATADVRVVDWKSPGDGLLVYDDVNQREWIKLTLTSGRTYGDIAAQLGPGGEFEGFSPALRADVRQLGQSAGVDTNTSDYATNVDAVLSLSTALGLLQSYTIAPAPPYELYRQTTSGGWLASNELFDPPNPGNRDLAQFETDYYEPGSPAFGYAGLALFTIADQALAHQGVWLYRASTIPEPATRLSIVVTAFIPLRSRRR